MSSEIGRDYVMIFIVKSEWLHKSFAKLSSDWDWDLGLGTWDLGIE